MVKSIIFIIPYYGKFPPYFQLWLDSCKYNPTIHWLIFTDIEESYNYPINVSVKKISFKELKKYIQTKYDFTINLESPYKLCDYKPAYGEIFQEYISKYDYWGYCDIDLIWGNIKNFITDELLEKSFDKICNYGHCTLYKNTKENNQVYKTNLSGIPNYQQVFSSPYNFCFDENHGIMLIYEQLNKNICNSIFCYDVKVRRYKFRPAWSMYPTYSFLQKKNGLFHKTKNNLYFIYLDNGKVKYEEFMYVHLQKRKMYLHKQLKTNKTEYCIIPNKFIPSINLTPNSINGTQPPIWHIYWDLIKSEWKQKTDIIFNRPRTQLFYKGRFEKIINFILFRK